ncbi:hypothetical protein ACFV0H_25340 [Streptomyces erythrochromogenes]|uniref:hypothetical protein n=1 Tax=Streptomyces erythrochromogenes TaxID=285574 RepID=UPI00367BE766
MSAARTPAHPALETPRGGRPRAPGCPAGVPALLRGLLDETAGPEALRVPGIVLMDGVLHMSAVMPAALPYLIGLAAVPGTTVRPGLLDLLIAAADLSAPADACRAAEPRPRPRPGRGSGGTRCDPAPVDPNDKHWRTWTLRFLALLAADLPDQQAWLGERRLTVQTAVEEVEFAGSIAEGLTDRAVFTPGHLHTLRAIARRTGALDATARTARWADSLAADPAWNDVRTLARDFLHTLPDDRPRPLPRPVRPNPGDC